MFETLVRQNPQGSQQRPVIAYVSRKNNIGKRRDGLPADALVFPAATFNQLAGEFEIGCARRCAHF